MTEPENVELRQGAVAVVDALGFKEARKTHGVQELVTSIKHLRRKMREDAHFKEQLGSDKLHVAAFSDTIIMAAFEPKDPTAKALLGMHGTLSGLAYAVASLVVEAASTAAALPYRGCLAAGPLLVDDEVFVGEAIDEAAEWYEQGNAALVWLTPSARAAIPRPDPILFTTWNLELKNRGSLEVLAVNPFVVHAMRALQPGLDLAVLDDSERLLLASFGKTTRVDVAQKLQNTAGFLAKAKAETVTRFDEWRADFWSTNASLGDEVDAEKPNA